MHDGREIANFALDRCQALGRPLSNLALQKLIFFCHAWSLAKRNKPLIRHKFEAWKFGPVLQYLYRDFKEFDDLPITGRALRIDPLTGEKVVATCDLDAETKEFLTQVIDFYSRLRAGTLVELSHVEGGPWHEVWHHSGDVNPGMTINDELIANFYSRATAPF